MAAVGQFGDFGIIDGDIGVGHQRSRYRFRERITIHGQRATGGQAVLLGHLHDQPVSRPHFPMQQAHGVLFVIIRPERVGTDHLGQMAGPMRKGCHLGPHFVDDHLQPHVGGLPGCFRSGHAAADDM